jgi:MoaA/NifB/PqqE/SkfB family radical SAM enzyme
MNSEVRIAIRNPCNYSCYYCVGHNEKQETVLFDLGKIAAFYASWEGFVVTSFECGAGEPTLHPQIKELLNICASKGMSSIPTNGSTSPKRWMPDKASSIYLRAALHPQSEKDFEGFMRRLLEAKEMGAFVSVTYVLHPDRVEQAEKYKAAFKEQGIYMGLSAFTGTHNGKDYPLAHSVEERKMIGESAGWNQQLQCDTVTRKFGGIPCFAGSQSIYVTPSGNFRRCLYDTNEIQAPLKVAEPCRISGSCGCGWLLEELNTLSPEFWNYWRGLAGLERMPSEGLNDDQLYQRNRAKYLELMTRYGKL